MPKVKKEVKKEAPEASVPNDVMDSLTDSEMSSLMAELYNSKYWPAILRYNRLMDVHCVNTLATTDPFKEPTKVAQAQGIRIGLYYLEQDIYREGEKRRKESDESIKK